MRTVALAIACVLITAPAVAQGKTAHRAMLTAYAGVSAMDMASSMYYFGSGTMRESNPAVKWTQDRPFATGAVWAASNAAAIYALDRLHRKHPRVAVVATAAALAIKCAVVARTYRQAHEARR